MPRRKVSDSEHVFRLYRELSEVERTEFELLARGAAIASAKPTPAPEKRKHVKRTNSGEVAQGAEVRNV